jgi:hypothetical protein
VRGAGIPPHFLPGCHVKLHRALHAGDFSVREQTRGPPFGILPGQTGVMLTLAFERIEDAAVDDSIPVFLEWECRRVWQRR